MSEPEEPTTLIGELARVLAENPERRKVSTDALETLGNIIDDTAKRDAIHLAVIPTIAKEKFHPGDHVGPDGTKNNPVGIVDPFLFDFVLPGQRFWLVIYPRMITSLRHVWSHPAFPEEDNTKEAEKAKSELWLRQFTASHDCPDYETVMKAISGQSLNRWDGDDASVHIDDEHITFIGIDAHCSIPQEFWEHAERVLGRPVLVPKVEHFSCSC